MTQIILFLAFVALLTGAVVGRGLYVQRHRSAEDLDRRYRDRENRHAYYERSLLEKERYLREHPESRDTVRRLWKKRK